MCSNYNSNRQQLRGRTGTKMLIFTLIGSSLDRKKKKAKIRACKKWKSCRSKACRLFPLTFRKIGTEREEDGASIRSRRCPELRGYHVKKSYSTRLLFHVYRSRLRASNKNKFTTRTFVRRRWVTITRYIRSQNYSWYITRDKSSPDILRRGKNLRESIFYFLIRVPAISSSLGKKSITTIEMKREEEQTF